MSIDDVARAGGGEQETDTKGHLFREWFRAYHAGAKQADHGVLA